MMRRTRAFLPLCVLLLPLAVACSGENIPPATGPAHQTPTATESPELSPPAAPTAASTATATPAPEPTPPPSPQQTATPPPPATEYLPLTMGEPRTLPAGTALYVRSYGSCEGPQDWHRGVATDTHELLWDEPLSELPHGGDLGGVSASGNTLAAVSCERGVCMSIDGRSEDAISALWVSGDGGESWERWGEVPTSHRGISLVTDDDVALQDAWPEQRAWWYRSGEEVLPPGDLLNPRIWGWRAGGDGLQPLWAGIGGTAFVSASGEDLPRPMGFRIAASLPDGSLFWGSTSVHRDALGRDLFLRFNDQGAVLGAYFWDGPRPLQLIDHLGGQLMVGLLGTYACGDLGRTVLVDFVAQTVHAIPGLDEARGFVPFAARPAPSIAYTPLTLGEPRELPAGVALYYYTALRCTLCKPLPLDVRRAVFDEGAGELRQDRPLAFFDEEIDFFDYSGLDYGTQRVTSFGVSRSGQTLAVTLCHVGRCQVEPVGGVYPTVDWDLRLWVSDDGGRIWEDRGLLLPETAIVDVTDEDVLLRTRNFWRYADRKYTRNGREHMRLRLEPLGLDALEGREHWFRWAVSGAEHVPSNTEPTPPSGGRVDWRQAVALPGGSVAWSAEAEGVYLLAIAGEEGTVEHILGSAKPLWGLPSVHDLVLSPVTLPSLYLLSVVESGEVRRSMLLDLATSIIHPIDGLPQDDRWSNAASVFLSARPAPD